MADRSHLKSKDDMSASVASVSLSFEIDEDIFLFVKSIGEELNRQFQNSFSSSSSSSLLQSHIPRRIWKNTMRTRFLNIDYFSTPPSQVFETLGFLNLPAPDNFPAPLVCDGVDDRLRFGSLENVCLPIGNLPIEAALSKFLSDVVPDRVSVDYGVLKIDHSSLGDYFSDEVRFLGGEILNFLSLAVYMTVSVKGPWFLIVRLVVDFSKFVVCFLSFPE